MTPTRPGSSSPGLEFVRADVYKRSDFPDGVPLQGGGRSSENPLDPTKVSAEPVDGYRLAAGQGMEDVVYLHFHVASDQRPLETSGAVYSYEQDGKEFKQTLAAVFRLENPPAGG